jgi:hypothetical protein
MEPKKLKKLVINKETISSLNNDQLSKHKGGTLHSVMDLCIPCATYDCTPTGVTTCPCVTEGCPWTWK